MDQETSKRLHEARGDIAIEINNLSPQVKVNCNDIIAVYLAINSLICVIQDNTEAEIDEILYNIATIADSVMSFSCESKEQADVMRRILYAKEAAEDDNN